MSVELLVLRLLHVLGGIAWLGFGAYQTYLLAPALNESGPAAGVVMGKLQARGVYTVLPIIAVVTMLSGLRLLMITSTGFSAAYFETRSGFTYAAGGAAALTGFIIALLVTRPSAVQLGGLVARRASATPEEQQRIDGQLARIRGKVQLSGHTATGLLVASGAAMAVARYL